MIYPDNLTPTDIVEKAATDLGHSRNEGTLPFALQWGRRILKAEAWLAWVNLRDGEPEFMAYGETAREAAIALSEVVEAHFAAPPAKKQLGPFIIRPYSDDVVAWTLPDGNQSEDYDVREFEVEFEGGFSCVIGVEYGDRAWEVSIPGVVKVMPRERPE
jgi:hypothetical protein